MDKKESEMTLMVKGYCGIGDHVQERPFVLDASKRYKAVYVETAFPDLFYAGIKNVICLERSHIVPAIIDRIADCKKKGLYGKPLGQYDKIVKLSYGHEVKSYEMPVLEAFNSQLPHSDFANITTKLEKNIEWELEARKFIVGKEKICLVKLPTFRYEHCRDVDYMSRNPKMEYVGKAIKAAKQAGYYVVSISDLKAYKERLDGAIPAGIDLLLHEGELSSTAMFGMHSLADAIITTPCSSLHLGIAYSVPTIAIFGGFATPEIYYKPLKAEKLTCISPKTRCNCFDVAHKCDKNIDEKELNEGIAKFFGIKAEPIVGEIVQESGRPYRLVMRHGVQRKLWL